MADWEIHLEPDFSHYDFLIVTVLEVGRSVYF